MRQRGVHPDNLQIRSIVGRASRCEPTSLVDRTPGRRLWLRQRRLRDGTDGDPKTKMRPSEFRLARLTHARSAAGHDVVIRAPTDHSKGLSFASAAITNLRILASWKSNCVTIAAPFSDVAVHVEQAPGVRFFQADTMT